MLNCMSDDSTIIVVPPSVIPPSLEWMDDSSINQSIKLYEQDLVDSKKAVKRLSVIEMMVSGREKDKR